MQPDQGDAASNAGNEGGNNALSRTEATAGDSTEPSVRAHSDQLWRDASRQFGAAIADRERAGRQPGALDAQA